MKLIQNFRQHFDVYFFGFAFIAFLYTYYRIFDYLGVFK